MFFEMTAVMPTLLWGLDEQCWHFTDKRAYGLWTTIEQWEELLLAGGFEKVLLVACARRLPRTAALWGLLSYLTQQIVLASLCGSTTGSLAGRSELRPFGSLEHCFCVRCKDIMRPKLSAALSSSIFLQVTTVKDTRGYAALFLYRKIRQGPTPEPVFIAGPAMDLPDAAVTVCILLCHSPPSWDSRFRSRAGLLLTSEPHKLMT